MSSQLQLTHGTLWFNGAEIKAELLKWVNPGVQHNILEIGCFEGLSSHFFAEYLCNHPDSTLTCVDPFDTTCTTTPVNNQTRENFMHNIKLSQNYSKVTVHEMYSNRFFREIQPEVPTYDIIYIDGSHEPIDIMTDMIACDKLLKVGGIMWMDDYLGGSPPGIRQTMDNVIAAFGDRYYIIHKGYQIAVQKVK